MADTTASGATPISRASRSATSIQASMAPTRIGDIPVARGAVEHQPGQQQRRLGADVVGLEDQDEHAGAELGRDHDPGGDEHPHDALAARRAAPGQQRAGQHDQRVADRRRHVQHVRVQAAEVLHQHVLGQLGGVERHVGDRPAAQHRVAVQHGPGLQRVGRAVGTDPLRPRDVQITEVEPDPDRDQADQPGQPDQPRAPPPRAALPRGVAPGLRAGACVGAMAGVSVGSGAGPGPTSVTAATSASVSVSATATAKTADSSLDGVDMLPH